MLSPYHSQHISAITHIINNALDAIQVERIPLTQYSSSDQDTGSEDLYTCTQISKWGLYEYPCTMNSIYHLSKHSGLFSSYSRALIGILMIKYHNLQLGENEYLFIIIIFLSGHSQRFHL